MTTGSRAGDEVTLTSDARGALERAGFSRRDFLKGTGALVVSFSMGMIGTAAAQGVLEGGTAGSPPAGEVDS